MGCYKEDLLCVPSFQEGQLFRAIPEHPGEKRRRKAGPLEDATVDPAPKWSPPVAKSRAGHALLLT